MMKKYVKLIIIGIAAVVLVAAGLIYYLTPDSLRVVMAKKLSIEPQLIGTGKIEGDKKLVIYSDVAGVIDARHVQVGDRVEEGEILVSYRGESQQEQVELAENDAHYSEKIAQSFSDLRAGYEGRYNAAVKKIGECELVYATIEANILELNAQTYISDFDIKQRKKTIESDISKLEEQISEKQSRLAKYEYKMKLAELEENDDKMDDYVDDAKDIQDEISDLNGRISKLRRDAICLPDEGMDPDTYRKYLEFQNNLETVMRIWTDAKNEKDTNLPLMNAYSELYTDEQQADRDRISLDHAKKELSRALQGTKAPVDGVITEVLVDSGAYVDRGVPVLEMQTSESYKVKMMVSKFDINSVSVDQAADIRIGNDTYTGRVIRISQSAESDSAGKAKASVEIGIDTDEEFIVGLDADVTLNLGKVDAALSVPTECIYTDDGGSFVYVVRDSEVDKQYIILGASDSEYTQVEGINDGEHVVIDPAAGSYLGEEICEDMDTGI